MNPDWDARPLMEPLSTERPCGQNLDDTAVLASFDAFHLFGHSIPLDPTPDWSAIRDQSLDALSRSKDLRLLAHLAPALLRTDGIGAFSSVLGVARHWLESWWDNVFPLVDDDAIQRRNVLNCLADPWAVVDALRRAPLVDSRQHGTVTLRDLDIVAGMQAAAPGAPSDEGRIKAALASIAPDDLRSLRDALTAGVTALRAIDTQMRDAAGIEAVPQFEGLLGVLTRMQRALPASPAPGPAEPPPAASDQPRTATPPAAPAGAATAADLLRGAVHSREDALHALEAAADFFRRHEPSSPVPLFIERASRLVSRSFIEALADIVPDAVSQARAAAGLQRE
jgi:type VI secretion system protein ImpA